jgi:hypothetical protein
MTTDTSTDDAAASVVAAVDARTNRLWAQVDALGQTGATALRGFAGLINSSTTREAPRDGRQRADRWDSYA